MEYYLQIFRDRDPQAAPVWEIEDKAAQRIDIISSDPPFRTESEKDVLALLKEQFPASSFHKLRLRPGEYFPCMARPTTANPTESLGTNPENNDKTRRTRANSVMQLHALIGQLEKICRVVHPEGTNLKAFGHEIRNVLILLCTEVEAHWKCVLGANGAKGESTKEYVKLSGPLKLPEYRIDFPYYPWLQPIRPFENWRSSSSPSKSLPWYSAYNHVKHDREASFSEATLERAFQALAGCFVMLCAQYGWDFARKGAAADREFLRLLDAPTWSPSDVYVHPHGTTWKPKHYQF